MDSFIKTANLEKIFYGNRIFRRKMNAVLAVAAQEGKKAGTPNPKKAVRWTTKCNIFIKETLKGW